MKEAIIRLFKVFGLSISRFSPEWYHSRREFFRLREVYNRYREYTMIGQPVYLDNLSLAMRAAAVPGDLVECGVWRGGMSAGISEVLNGSKKIWLFDSFEGLPPAGDKDGDMAHRWQADKEGQHYYDNCSAEESYAREAMGRSGYGNYELVKGWFEDTLPAAGVKQIALLRLDGDWYGSTMTCLENLYSRVSSGGIVIIDDYYQWEGCARAVHDYLSRYKLSDRIQQTRNGVAYIVKDQPVNAVA